MKFKNKIIAVDFDGTCVTHEFPYVGRDIGSEKVLKRLVAEGARLILYTMRSSGAVRKDFPDVLVEAVEWFKERDIPLFGVNHNPEQGSWTESPKVYAHIYIDDAALGCPLKPGLRGERPYVDWDAVEALLFGH